jgi:periplasmic protein TonB
MNSQQILFLDHGETAVNAKRPVVLPPREIDLHHDVFAEAMLEDNSTHQRRSPLDWIASMGVHFAILAVLLILPLYFTAGLDSQRLNLMFLAPPPVAAAGPPPPMISSAAPRPSRPIPVRTFDPTQLTAPSFIPKAITSSAPGASMPPDEPLMGMAGGVPGGIPGGQIGGVMGGVLGGVVKGVPPPPAPAIAVGPKVPVRVGGIVKPPRLLFGPEPAYPILAMQEKLSGLVIIEAIIDEHGDVKGMQVVSGHPLLVPAALTAVSKRKYEPTILDGEPMPIDLRVEIRFSFS